MRHAMFGLSAFLVAVALAPRSAGAQTASTPDSDFSTGVTLCNTGDAKACNVVGAMYATGMHGVKLDHTQSFKYFEKSCDAGHPIGCANLANQYYNGLGVTTDRAHAVAVYQKGCDLGAVTACVDLGVIYRDGKGGAAKDQVYSAKLFVHACELSPAACASIASMYELGWGVPKDLARAKALYDRSCHAPRSDLAEDIQKVWSTAACNVLTRMK